MTQNIDTVTRDILDKVTALTGTLSDQQRAQVKQIIEDTVDERVAAKLEDSKYKPAPEPGSVLAGTRYARLGLSEIDVQMAHGILSHARQIGISRNGPSEELANVVGAIQERVAADDKVHERAMDTSDTTAVIGVQYVSEIWRASMQDAIVAPLLRSFPMKAKQAYIPVFGAPPVPVAYDESTADDSADYDAQDMPFARVLTTAYKFGLHQKWSGEIEEESIIPFVSVIRERQQASLAIFTDDQVVNADTTIAATGNINSDDAQLASNDYRVKFDGIRKVALVDNTANKTDASGTLTYAKITGLRTLCVDRARKVAWGHPGNPREFVFLVNPEGYESVGNLTELLTVDKYGQNATVLSGEVASIGRNPLLVTMAMPATEADGKVSATAGNNTKNQILGFNVNAASLGYLRQITVETYRVPQRDQNGIILFYRVGLARYSPTGAASAAEWAAALYNF